MMLDRTAHNRLAALADSRLGIGGNNPPGPIDFANESIAALSDWMKDHPVVESEDDARAAKLLADRAKGSLDTMEAERDRLVRPLNEEVAAINGRYRPIRTALEKVLDALKKRLTAYAKALEAERLRQAEEARRVAEEAEAAAREAEAREREAAEDASQGVCDVDIGAATIAADAAFAAFEKTQRAAERAERDTHVRIAGGFTKALGLRTREILTVTDWKAAIEEIGLTDAIRDAILTGARAYRKEFHELPEGIASEFERAV
jgi:hypothetical protein